MSFNFITAAEAASYIKDGDIVGLSGFTPAGSPKAVTAELAKIAEELSKPFPFVRVDLYSIDGRIYFSELTFTPAKGTLVFDDDKADFIQGEWLSLPR